MTVPNIHPVVPLGNDHWILNWTQVNGLCLQTLDVGLVVQRHQTLQLRRGLRRLRCRVEQRQQRGCQFFTHFSGAEAGVRPLVRVVAEGEFGERTGPKDGRVTGAERVGDDESVVKDQEAVFDALEGVVVDPSAGEVNQHLRGHNQSTGFEHSQYNRLHMTTDIVHVRDWCWDEHLPWWLTCAEPEA